ncbi:MAG: 2'-5' RNA ligase family protein [Flavobacteriales bacterium]|nr:2'-5' RNA ligase family protein [Flavobacteriales bacterium]
MQLSLTLNSEERIIIKEYSLIIDPPLQVKKEVKSFKGFWSRDLGRSKYVKSIPHITIASFGLNSNQENVLCDRLKIVCQHIIWPKLVSTGIDVFNAPDSKVISVNFIRSKPLIEFKRSILKAIKSSRPLEGVKSANPHMTIWDCETESSILKSWVLFSDIDYKSEFQTTRLILRKRDIKRLQPFKQTDLSWKNVLIIDQCE